MKKEKQNIKRTILVIDDEKAMAVMIKGFLTKRGFNVISINSGEEGIVLAKEIEPDLIILDLIMPDINGFDVLKKLKSNYKTDKIPIIILTSSVSEINQEKCLLLGASKYLDKTLSEDMLIEEIEKYIYNMEEYNGSTRES